MDPRPVAVYGWEIYDKEGGGTVRRSAARRWPTPGTPVAVLDTTLAPASYPGR